MAIYHFAASVISRARGQSAVAAAAYRLGVALRDERYGVSHNYVGKRGVTHVEILAPEDAPSWVFDRQALWNRVEAGESRRDAQLARLIEIGLPLELSSSQRLDLLRDFIAQEFVAKGMIADFCMRGSAENPHAHVLLTLRRVDTAGFGLKERLWNGKAVLLEWRIAWAELANEHLARAGHAARIDHRTLAEQQIELTPSRRVGIASSRLSAGDLPEHLAARLLEQRQIADQNAALILEDPTVALRALTHRHPTFTSRDLERFLRSRTSNPTQHAEVTAAIMQSADLVRLATLREDEPRFTSRDMVEAEKSLHRRTASMLARRGHEIAASRRSGATVQSPEAEQRAFEYLMSGGDIKTLVLHQGQKASILGAAGHAWAGLGWDIRAVAPSRRAAAQLQAMTGFTCRSLEAAEEDWRATGEVPAATVVLCDGAQMLSLKQLERVLAVADRGRALAVLVADAELIEAGSQTPFADILRAATQH